MDYALDVLLPVMPKALRAGLGTPQIRRLRRLENAARRLWRQWAGGAADADFDAYFGAALAQTDRSDWTYRAAEAALELMLAEQCCLDRDRVRGEFRALLSGSVRSQAEVPSGSAAMCNTRAGSASTVREGPLALGRSARTSPDRRDARREEGMNEPIKTPSVLAAPPCVGDGAEINSQASRAGSVQPDQAAPRGRQDHQYSTEVSAPKGLSDQGAAPTDLKSLRARAWMLATRLAERHGMGHLIKPLAGEGYGYLITDILTTRDAHEHDAERALRDATLWWHLVACCEGSSLPLEILARHLPAASGLRQFCETQDPALLLERVPVLDPSSFGPLLWSQLADADWSDLLGLMDCYRQIRQRVVHQGAALWKRDPHGCD
jgi:hypothetical protein